MGSAGRLSRTCSRASISALVRPIFRLASDRAVPIVNGDAPARFLLLQGRPIGEPVAQHGPFVMNSREEIEQALRDFRDDRLTA